MKNHFPLKVDRVWSKKVFATDACMYDFNALITELKIQQMVTKTNNYMKAKTKCDGYD